MNQILKLISATFILSLFVFKYTVCQVTITILSGNPSDGSLKLDSGPSITVDQYTRVNWVIAKASNVASIDNIYKKKKSPGVFIGAPRQEDDEWTGRVIFSPEKEYEYNIDWTEKGTKRKFTYDPKIAVKPKFHLGWLLAPFALIVGILFRFLNRKSRAA